MTIREAREHEREAILSGAPLKMSWGAVFGGVVAALGVAILLYALGLALGLNVVVDAQDPSSLRSSGRFTTIWLLVTSLVALFVGGLVAGRGAFVLSRSSGAIHGLVLWALTTLAGIWLVFNAFSTVVTSVASIGKTAVEAGAGAIASGAGPARDLAKNLGIDAQSALEPINNRLRAQGKPEITPQQLDAATKGVVQDALRTGKVDRETLVASISEHTALSRADSEEVARSVETQVSSGRQKLSQQFSDARQSLETGTLKVADTTGKVFWGVFVALLLGLWSAVLGATVGIRRRQRLWMDRPPPYEGGVGPDGGYYTTRGLHPRTNP